MLTAVPNSSRLPCSKEPLMVLSVSLNASSMRSHLDAKRATRASEFAY